MEFNKEKVNILIESQNGKQEAITDRPRRKPRSANGVVTVSDDFQLPLDDEMLSEFYK